MIYRQTINIERIAFSPLNDTNSTNCVELVKFGDTATFGVSMNNDEYEWYWEFDMSEPSDYERVKMNMYDAIFGCDTMEELGEALDAIFEDGFGEILIYEEGKNDDDDLEEELEMEENEDDKEEYNDHSDCGCVMCPFKCKH